MKKYVLLIVLFVFCVLSVYSQIPQGFNYQAVARSNNGDAIAETSVMLSIAIRSQSETGPVIWQEEHQVVTNEYGLFSIIVCGDDALRTGGTAITVEEIDWASGIHYLDIEIGIGSDRYSLGATQLRAVPYSLASAGSNSASSFEIQPDSPTVQGEALFIVKRNDGFPVFAVYEDGVWVYTDDEADGKSIKGGFAVGGYKRAKEVGQTYLSVTPDSTRVYVSNQTGMGGFSVGGYNSLVPGYSQDYLLVNQDSTRIYVNTEMNKGIKGGFAVGGYNTNKTVSEAFMSLQKDNYFIGHNSGSLVTTGLYNSVLGFESGYSITTGGNNAFLGYQAGYSNDLGSGNLFLGYQTGYSNVEGNNNTFVGNSAGYNNNGFHNTFLGSFTGYSNESGGFNTFVGDSAGFSNDEGYANTFIGTGAGLSNTVGYSNLMMGTKAGYHNETGSFNVFLGHESGIRNISGGQNVFIGFQTGHSNTDGTDNIFIGNEAGGMNTNGYSNLFIGTRAGHLNETGGFNVFLGHESGMHNVSGGGNVFVGTAAGRFNAEGYSNTFLGSNAGMHNTTGFSNLMIGTVAGHLNTIGSYNVFLGHESGYANIDGGANVFAGMQSGLKNTAGNDNIFLGTRSGQENVAGNGNVYIGFESGKNTVDGHQNVFIGNGAGRNEMGSGKLYIENTDADSSSALIWGNFYAPHLRFNASVGIYMNPEWDPVMNIYRPHGRGAISLYGDGNGMEYTGILLNADTSSNLSYYMSHKLDHNFELSFINDGIFNSRLIIDSTGNVGINSGVSAGGPTLNVFDDDDAASLVLQGVGDTYEYASLILQSDGLAPDKRYTLRHSLNNEFVLMYDNETDYNARLLVSDEGYISLNTWEPATEVLDVNGNARFRSVGTGTPTYDLQVTADGVLTTSTSDARLKEDFQLIQDGLEKVLSMEGLTFRWKDDDSGRRDAGLVAQNVLEVYPEAVFQNNNDDYYGINYSRFPALFVEAIKEQQKIIKAQEEEIEDLKERLARIELLLMGE